MLWPAYERLGAELLDEPVLFVDETPWPLLGKARGGCALARVDDGKPERRVLRDPRHARHRSRQVAARHVQGIAVTDGYGVYDALEKRMPAICIAQCWAAHPEEVRRLRIGASKGDRTDLGVDPRTVRHRRSAPTGSRLQRAPEAASHNRVALRPRAHSGVVRGRAVHARLPSHRGDRVHVEPLVASDVLPGAPGAPLDRNAAR